MCLLKLLALEPRPMDDLSRREALQLMAGIPLLAAGLSPETVRRATLFARTAMTEPRATAPVFFTPHEWETVRILVDLIIPRDDRSGSATDAGVPEFMDFILNDQADMQDPMRGGLGLARQRVPGPFWKDLRGLLALPSVRRCWMTSPGRRKPGPS